jgi:hypothetical protein
MKDLDIVEILQQSGSEEWQEAISSRLEPMRAYLSQDEWTKGVSVYLRASIGAALTKWLAQRGKNEDADYLKGYIAALRVVLSLPSSVEAEIARVQSGKNATKERGTAGY